MGKFTSRILKKVRPYGRGTAALKVAVLDPSRLTLPERMVTLYAGVAAVRDFVEWVDSASPDEKWLLESDEALCNLVAYVDKTGLTVLLRETPKSRVLPYSHACETFAPDESLRELLSLEG